MDACELSSWLADTYSFDGGAMFHVCVAMRQSTIVSTVVGLEMFAECWLDCGR